MDYLVTSQIIVENDVDEFNGMVLDYPDYESFSEETVTSLKQSSLSTDRLKQDDKDEVTDLSYLKMSHIKVDWI